MKANRFGSALLLSALIVPGISYSVDRAYLASDGNDAHPCTLAKPCRNLPAALAAVVGGGEIWMLDSGSYNGATVTIDKSVTVLAVPGAAAGLAAAGGPAVSITAAGLQVTLRNLVFSAAPGSGGTTGVHMTGASRLFVESSSFIGLPDRGVLVDGTGRARITNTLFTGNRYAMTARNGATVDVAGSTFTGNFAGVSAVNIALGATNTRVAVSDSTFAYHDFGLAAETFIQNSVATIHATRCTITNSSEYALFVWQQAIPSVAHVSIGGSLVANNNYAWFRSGLTGTISTFGNNQFIDNTTSFGGPLPVLALQ